MIFLYRALWASPPVRFIRQCAALYFGQRVSQASACLAYFVLLTAFPLLICVSYLLSLAHIDVAALVSEVHGVLPDAALDVLESYLFYISYRQSSALFLAGLAGCWLSAAAAYRTIARMIRGVYGVEKADPFRNMLFSILFPPALLLTLALSVVVVTTGQHTLQLLAEHVPFLGQFLQLWVWLRYVLLFAVFFLVLTALLAAASPSGTAWVPVAATSLVATVALVVSSGVFSWFISLSSRYSLVYGSLVSLVVLLIWLYLCGQILFLAMIFTNVWLKNRRKAENASQNTQKES